MHLNSKFISTLVALCLCAQIPAMSNLEEKQTANGAPKRILTQKQAVAYALELVNRDRAKHHIKPVSIDPVAMEVGQKHADEMAMYGYLSHWDLAGKKPIQRYSENGGTDYASENVGLTAIHSPKSMPSSAVFQSEPEHHFLTTDLEEFETDFMNEKPPNDGHRQQILDPNHNKLGIGVSFAELKGQGRISIAQEFVNHYGKFEKIPSTLRRKTSFSVAGLLPEHIILDQVKIEREPLSQPQTPTQLERGPRTSAYEGLPILEYVAGKDPQLKIKREQNQTKFSVLIQVDDDWEPGLYYVLVWAKVNGKKDRILVSARTAQLD